MEKFKSLVVISKKKLAKRKEFRSVNRLQAFFCHHVKALLAGWIHLTKYKMVSFMTIGTMGLLLTFPLGVGLLFHHFNQMVDCGKYDSQVSIYLKKQLSQQKAEALYKSLSKRKDIKKAKFITPEEGLAFFKKTADLEAMIAQLPENPLPNVIQLYPYQFADHQHLINELGSLEEVALVQFDYEWLARLNSLFYLVKKSLLLVLVFLVMTVILVTANSTRMIAKQRHDEVAVIYLVGGTKAFIRRPFLYLGLFLGVLGGVLAWFMVTIALFALDLELQNFFQQFSMAVNINYLNLKQGVLFIVASGLLGWVGAFISVDREFGYLKKRVF